FRSGAGAAHSEDPRGDLRRPGEDDPAEALHRVRRGRSRQLQDDRGRRRAGGAHQEEVMATGAGAYPEPVIPWLSKSRLRLAAVLVLLAAFYSASWHFARVDPAKLLSGLPQMASWAGKAWPPATDELPVLL